MSTSYALAHCLLGTALGDSIGLPYEGSTPAQVRRRMGDRLEQRFLPGGGGMASDDTDHTRLVATALIADPTCGDAYERALASGLRWWFLGLPVGIGLGTARACIKLCLGWPARSSGVRSAGNGPAMRSALLGVLRPDDDAWLRHAVHITTRLTHTDPRAEQGALLVARLAAVSSLRPVEPADVEAAIADLDPDLATPIQSVVDGVAAGSTPADLVDPRGVTGFVLHTLPAVVAVVLAHPRDFEAAITTAVLLGGDTDTVGAIVGAIVGSGVGIEGLPARWLDGYRDWPWSAERLTALASALADGTPAPTAPPVALFRNLAMLPLAIGHLIARYL